VKEMMNRKRCFFRTLQLRGSLGSVDGVGCSSNEPTSEDFSSSGGVERGDPVTTISCFSGSVATLSELVGEVVDILQVILSKGKVRKEGDLDDEEEAGFLP
jgi:hypothetical protein